MADATRHGGIPPLFLEPIDFAALYQQSVNKIAEAGATGGDDTSGEDPSANGGGNA